MQEKTALEEISVKMQLGWYRQMCLIRAFEHEVYQLNTAGLVRGTAHLYIGMEAIAVGACSAMRDEDFLTSTHRGHGHCISRNLDLGRMAEIWGGLTVPVAAKVAVCTLPTSRGACWVLTASLEGVFLSPWAQRWAAG